MQIADIIAIGLVVLFLLLITSYLIGWSFSAGYHNHKYQHTKRLVQLLREGNTTQ